MALTKDDVGELARQVDATVELDDDVANVRRARLSRPLSL